jgi:ribA/ribD-fused uncharacterized protein
MTTYIYFWKPHETHGYLGNWYPSPFRSNNILFSNNEQYFMWRKQQLFDSANTALEAQILSATNPKVMKDLGRRVKNFDQNTWDQHKYAIMKAGIYEKFTQNPDLRQKLLDTKTAILVEASPFDNVWGIGLNATDAKSKPWKGENLLGKALMDIRSSLGAQP